MLLKPKISEKREVSHFDLSFVVPALNEEDGILNTLKNIPLEDIEKIGLTCEVIVVDNNSDDRTGAIARQWGAQVVVEQKRGYGNAYLRGFSEAKGDIIVMFDADGTYPVEDTLRLIRPIRNGDSDVVMGSRLNGTIMPNAMSYVHRFGNHVLTLILNILFGLRITDAHSGFRAFKRRSVLSLGLKSPGMAFASELVIKSAQKKLKIVEIPILYRPREGSLTKLNTFRDGWRHLKFMLWERFCNTNTK